jgi:hypothetical protein
MSDSSPAILAAYCKTNLRFLEADPGLGTRAVSLMSEATLRRIRSARRIEWLPWDYVVDAAEALFRAAGSEEGVIELARRSLASTFDEPFFQPIISSGLVILGRSPDRLASWLPTLWKAVTRDAGKLEWSSDGETSGCLQWEGAPRSAIESPVYPSAVAASFYPLFDLARTKGRIIPQIRGHVIVFSFTWEAP